MFEQTDFGLSLFYHLIKKRFDHRRDALAIEFFKQNFAHDIPHTWYHGSSKTFDQAEVVGKGRQDIAHLLVCFGIECYRRLY
jgi:hypothetical protein